MQEIDPKFIRAGFTCHKGADFLSTGGQRVLSFQMLRDGRAFATADFTGDHLDRFLFADSCEAEAREWLAVTQHLLSL